MLLCSHRNIWLPHKGRRCGLWHWQPCFDQRYSALDTSIDITLNLYILKVSCVCDIVVPGSCFLSSTSALLNIALAFGITLFVVIFFTAPFSGERHLQNAAFALLRCKIWVKQQHPAFRWAHQPCCHVCILLGTEDFPLTSDSLHHPAGEVYLITLLSCQTC